MGYKPRQILYNHWAFWQIELRLSVSWVYDLLEVTHVKSIAAWAYYRLDNCKHKER